MQNRLQSLGLPRGYTIIAFSISGFGTIKEWKSSYLNPIKLEQNEIIEIKENNNPNWKGWIFCESLNSSGWAAEQIINRIEKNKGLIKKKYSAKEMNISDGERVIGLKELNGWIWAKRKTDNNEGWLPYEILKELTKKSMVYESFQSR